MITASVFGLILGLVIRFAAYRARIRATRSELARHTAYRP